MDGRKRGAKIGFFQNGKVEQVSFRYAWRKHDFGRIEDLPFLDWFWKFKFFFATMLHVNIMPSLEFINSYESTACPASLLYS